jgi:hypothetical protein
VPVLEAPPIRAAGETEEPDSAAAVMVRMAFRVIVPYEPDMVALAFAATGLVVTLKVPLVAPAGMVRLGGTCAAALLLESAICTPPAGAAAPRLAVAVEDTPPLTEVGFNVIDEKVTD